MTTNTNTTNPAPEIHVIRSPETWIEGKAVQQLETVSRLPGMRRTVGMPDLHPGRDHPIGVASLSDGIIYPHLVGGDGGCGMGLWRTGLRRRDLKNERAVRRLTVL